MAYNPAYKSLVSTYFQGEYVYNYGGDVPKYPVIQTSQNPTPTPTPTPSATIQPSLTPTQTPSITPSPICNNQFIVSSSTSSVFDNGTYSRRYVISGDSIDYGYAVRITATSGYIVKGLAPDGEKYTLWQFPNGDINSVIMAFDPSNVRQGWMAQEQTPNLLQSGTTWIGASIIISSNRVFSDGYYYPPSGAVSGGVITYPSSCPTPTPTNSSTPTPSMP
jgi:hypothetical protein